MSRNFIALTALNLSILCSTTWAETISIVAITSKEFPFEGVDQLSGTDISLQILNLDSVDDIERRLSEGLPASEAEAKEIAQRRIAEIGQAKLDEDIRLAYLPLATMMSSSLDRYPAILFDGQAVVYGVTDIPLAIGYYQRWKTKQSKGERYE